MSRASKIIAGFSVVAVVSAIVFGLFSIGSPEHRRVVRLDDSRTNDLQALGLKIHQFYVRTGELPTSLEPNQLRRSTGEIYRDPVTSVPYELVVVGERNFQLCAVFETEDPHHLRNEYYFNGHPRSQPAPYEETITGSGRQCFSIEFSPES